MEKAKVYFTKELTVNGLKRLFEVLQPKLNGKVAVKVHSGEVGNQNFIRPQFFQELIQSVNGTIVECNTAYEGKRNTTKEHWETMKLHGWCDVANVDIMDEEGELSLPVPNGRQITENFVGSHLKEYDSMLVLSHFKGHPMGGFGGALKQLSIGCASTKGKCLIHSGGKTGDQTVVWDNVAEQDVFCEAMADAAGSVMEYFRGNTAFVNMMCNLSVDCDCCAVAEDPCMKDIGILSSLDSVALDQACMDLIYQSKDPGRDHFLQRVESRHGTHTIDAAAELGFGMKEYELISV